MMYETERDAGEPCGNDKCGFHVRNKADQQNCDAEMCGEPAIASCKQYAPDGKAVHIDIDPTRMSPSEICTRYQVQNCHCCDRMECGDNTSNGKRTITAAQAEIARLRAYIAANPPCDGGAYGCERGKHHNCGIADTCSLYIAWQAAQSAGNPQPPQDLPALWDAAFAAFKDASERTYLGRMPGAGFDLAVRMWTDFESIIGMINRRTQSAANPQQPQGNAGEGGI